VPGPIKYQRSFEGGVLTPFFEGLVATLFVKLRSVDALTRDVFPLDLSLYFPSASLRKRPAAPAAAAPMIGASQKSHS